MADSLFADRKENFESLRFAVDKIADIRDGRRGDLINLIEKLEVKTIRDGLCHFTRGELYEQLHWKATKFDTVRELAERLGWISVIRYPQARGGQGANKYQVNWLRIRSDAAKPAISLPPKRGRRLPQNGNRIPQNGRRLPQNGNRVEDAPARHPIKNPNQNPIYHERPNGKTNGDGPENGFYKNSSGGWKTPITVSELKDPTAIERRYREAVERFRDFIHSESNRLRFFGLARDAVTNPNVKHPPAWFTGVLKRGSVPTDGGCEWGRQAILQLDRQKNKPTNRAAAQEVATAFSVPQGDSLSPEEKREKSLEWAKSQGYTGR